ncbi:MAG: alpha/beta hydrolase [Candidatus Promineofilum sp.]|jgi:pimeloyl-ACP methyl ester carboxylesterase|nr:alpha/beta hydrolase [Promineifilum sp.]
MLQRVKKAFGPTLPPDTDAVIDDVLASDLRDYLRGETGLATSGSIQIWYESILPEGTPQGSILLLMGMGGDCLMWPPSFVRTLVDAGYHVIRYDHRGTGMSDWVKGWSRQQPYTLADMAGDAIAVLNATQTGRAHLVGLSMGGMVAQEAAIQAPDRVASLTLMMTSGHVDDPDLPQTSSRYFIDSLSKGLPLLKYRLKGGERNLIKERIAKQIAFLGTEGLDVQALAEVVTYDLRHRRGINLQAMRQHLTAISNSGSRYERLSTLNVPTLVIHGTDDLLIPLEHAKKLVATIPDAEGVWLDGVGHAFPMAEMAKVIERILLHVATSTTTAERDLARLM